MSRSVSSICLISSSRVMTWGSIGGHSDRAYAVFWQAAVSGKALRAACDSTINCPTLDYPLKLRQAIGQCGRAGLQDQRRFDFIHVLALHSRYSIEARPRHNTLGPKF